MPIDVKEITDRQLEQLLHFAIESHFIDLKSKEIKPGKLTKTISAFANADGGDVYVGIRESKQREMFEDPPHQWIGFNKPEEANGHIQIFESLFPLGENFLYEFLIHPSQTGLILHAQINKTKAIIRSNDGLPYIRRGAQSLPVDTPVKLTTLERNKGITSFETEPVSCPTDRIADSKTIAGFMAQVVPWSAPDDWLRKQELITGDRPTVAGVVLFADLPQAILPKHTGIKIYRYRTGDVEGTRGTLVGLPVTIEGCAYDLIRSSVLKTKEIIDGIKVIGDHGFEPVTYPAETLHEVITNAVLHRDYSVADDVHVRIFDNRVEVESPGRLPAHITTRNILKQRFSRNGNLVRVINKFPDPPNKDIGEGLNTAFSAMRDMHLKEPVVEETESTVIVHIKHERLASADSIVVEYLQQHPMITNREARAITGIRSENSMKNVFWRLRDAGMIRQVAGRSGFRSAWELAK